MLTEPTNLTDLITAEVQRQTNSDTIKQLVEKKIGDIIASTVDSSLRSYGNVGKQIEKIVADSLEIHGEIDVPAYGQMVMALLRNKMDETLSTHVNERLSAEINDILQIAPKEIKITDIVQQMIDGLDMSERYGTQITCIIEESSYSKDSYHIYLDTLEDVRKYNCSTQLFATNGGAIHSLKIDNKDASKTIIMGSLWGWEKSLFAAYCSGSKLIMDDLDPSTAIGDY